MDSTIVTLLIYGGKALSGRGRDCEISWDVTAKCSGLSAPTAPGQHFLHTGRDSPGQLSQLQHSTVNSHPKNPPGNIST